MAGQPVYFLTPDVVGVHMKVSCREESLPTLSSMNQTVKTKVVRRFPEFHGEERLPCSAGPRHNWKYGS